VPGSEYGLHWRISKIGSYDSFYASGFGLQRIFVIPELEMVIVMTQNWYHDPPRGRIQMDRILEGILESLNSN
jgi:CubicO group peptidase (beta-lactamase class C family)